MTEQDAFFNDELYDDEDTMENVFLTFALADREYGLEVKNVIEITGLKSVTDVPDMPSYVKGIMNLRGKIIPLVDVRLRFKYNEQEYNERTCVIIVSLEDMLVGLIVDGVSEVLRIPKNQIENSPNMGGNSSSRFIKSIGKVDEAVTLILNLENFLGEGDIDAIEEAKAMSETSEIEDENVITNENSLSRNRKNTNNENQMEIGDKGEENLIKTQV
jgi:purine-binding chemotaxis protein CheW